MISVVMPLYNKEKFVLDSIHSVLSQKFKEFELIIIDDGSTDASFALVSSVRDARIRVIRTENQGVSRARNLGVEQSEFEFIAFLDADDVWSRCHLRNLAEARKAHSGAEFFSTHYVYLSDSDVKLFLNLDEECFARASVIDYFDYCSKGARAFCSSSVALRKDLFLQLGGFRNYPVGEDIEFWARISLRSTVVSCESVTCGLRIDPLGLSAGAVPRIETSELSTNNLPTPVLVTLEEALNQRNHTVPAASIERYFDFRISIGIVSAIRRGEYRRAVVLLRLLKSGGGLALIWRIFKAVVLRQFEFVRVKLSRVSLSSW